MEYILANTLLALLEYPGATLLGVNRMYTDKKFRDEVISHVTDPGVRSFWVDEYARYTDRFAAEATPAIQNKIGQFTSNPLIRNIIGQPKSSFDFRKMIDEKKIMIVNLSKGQVGEGNASLLGSMLITKIYLAAMSRADKTQAEIAALPPFYLYADEFQSFANESFADILSEARKYKLGLTMAHQYIEQMSEEVRDAVFGNVGTTIAFRVGPFDAEVLEKLFTPKFTLEDCINLGFTEIYLTLMIDGVGSAPFSARTLPPIAEPDVSYKQESIEHSRQNFAEPRLVVEDKIAAWHDEAALATGGGGGGGNNGGGGGSKPPSSPGQSSTSGAAKKRKKRAREEAAKGGGSSKPRETEIPPEAAADLGSNNLKDLLAGAMLEAKEINNNQASNDRKESEKPEPEIDESVYKVPPDEPLPPADDNESSDDREEAVDLSDAMDKGAAPEEKPSRPAEIPEDDLRQMLKIARDGD